MLRWWLWQDSGLGGAADVAEWGGAAIDRVAGEGAWFSWPSCSPANRAPHRSWSQAEPLPKLLSHQGCEQGPDSSHCRPGTRGHTSWEEEGKEEEYAFVVRLASLEPTALAPPHPRHSRATSSEPTDRVTRVPAQMRG